MIRYRRIPFQFLKGFIPPLLLLFLISGFFYQYTSSFVKKKLTRHNALELEEIIHSVDDLVIYLEERASLLSSRKDFRELASLENLYAPNNIFKVIYFQDELSAYFHSELIDSFHIYYPKSETVVDPHMLCKGNDFFSRYFHYEGLSPEETINYFKNDSPAGKILSSTRVNIDETDIGTPTEVITFFQVYGNHSGKKAVLMVTLSSQRFRELFTGFDFSAGGGYSIENSRGQILISNIEISNTDGKMIRTEAVSSLNKWHYSVNQNEKIVFRKLSRIRRMIVAVISSVLLGGILFTLFYSFFNGKKIIRLLDMVGSEKSISKSNDSWHQLLYSGIINIVDKNKTLANNLTKYKDFVCRDILEDLLYGHFSCSAEITEHFTSLPPKIAKNILSEEMCAGIAIYRDAANIQAINTVTGCLESFYHKDILLWIEKTRGEYLLLTSSKTASTVTECLLSGFPENFPLLGVYWGRSTGDAVQVCKSFDEAVFLSEQYMGRENSVVFNTDDFHSDLYYYPHELEEKIIQTVMAGHSEALEKLFWRIKTENFENRSITPSMRQLLVSEIAGTYNRLQNRRKKEIISIYIPRQSNTDVFEEIEILFGKIHRICETNNNAILNSQPIYDEMVEYVEKNFQNPNICLSRVSDTFGFSDSYFSRIFKEASGKTFQFFLEELRLQKAKDLLGSTSLPIQEIAELSGFASFPSFCRFFKRHLGVNAGVYRRGPAGYARSGESRNFSGYSETV